MSMMNRNNCWFLFRRWIGAAVLFTIILLLPDFSELISSNGLWPCSVPFSVRALSNSIDPICSLGNSYAPFLDIVIVMGLLYGAVLLSLGKGDPVRAAITWICLLCIHHRSYLIVAGGDGLLRFLLFVTIFIPSECPHRALRGSTVRCLEIMHRTTLALMYITTGLLKNGSDWIEGTALRTTSNDPEFSFSWFKTLLDYLSPSIERMVCQIIPSIEIIAGVWILASIVGRIPTRWVAFILAGLHLMILVSMRLENFPHVCLIGIFPLFFQEPVGETKSRNILFKISSVLFVSFFSLGIIVVDFGYFPAVSPVIIRTLGALGFIQTWKLFAPVPRLNTCYRELKVNPPVYEKKNSTLIVSTGRADSIIDTMHSRMRWQHFLSGKKLLSLSYLRYGFTKNLCGEVGLEGTISEHSVCEDLNGKNRMYWLWAISCDPKHY